MRNSLKWLGTGAAVLGMAFSMTSIARADDFTTDASDPVVISGSVDVWVVAVPDELPSDSDHAGCNVGSTQDAKFVIASVTSNNTSVATVNPPTLNFTGCGDANSQEVTITLFPAICDETAMITITEGDRGPGGSVKGVFNTETINVFVAGTSPTDPSCNGGGGPGEMCSEPAAPAWAAALLKASNLKAKNIPNYISAVARNMTNGAVFEDVPKSSQDEYANAVRDWLIDEFGLSLATVDDARVIRPGWDCTPNDLIFS
jgi:hypothetical protein